MRSIITFMVVIILMALWSFHDSDAIPAPSPGEDVQPYIYVIGAVYTPGRYGWTNRMTVLDGISAAKGFTDSAGDRLEIFRIGETNSVILDRYTITNQPPFLLKGDRIVVPSKARRIF